MTHTPGPWGYDGTGCVYSDALPKDDCVIAELLYADGDWEADGRLMAAAPELLAVCKLLLGSMGEVIEDHNEVAYSDLRMAIMRAEGET